MKNERKELIVNLLRIGAFLQRNGNCILHEFNINQQQFVVLNHIFRNQPVNQSNICSNLLFEKSNISKIISKLESLKYIDQRKSGDDKRSTVITCTKTGEKTITSGLKRLEELEMKILKKFSDTEISSMNEQVKKISNICKG